MTMLRVAISLHNLSTRHDQVMRGGISQVVFQAFKAITTAPSDGHVEFVPILRLPLSNPAEVPFFMATHFNASRTVIKATLAEIGLSEEAFVRRWPHLECLIRGELDEQRYDAECIRQIASCDLFFEVALADVRNVVMPAKKLNPKLKAGVLVHDLGPFVIPDYVDDSMVAWFQCQYKACLESLDFSISVSRHTALELLSHFHPTMPLVSQAFYCNLPTMADGPADAEHVKLTELFPELQGKAIFLSVATLEPRKNLELLIDAYLRSAELDPAMKQKTALVLVGASGWKNSILFERIAQVSGLTVVVPGYVDDKVLAALYQHASCLVMPSHYEGFGLPVAEARARGTPVICCANSALPEASELDATYVTPWNIDELACALIARVFEPGKPKRPNAAGERYGASCKTWQELVTTWGRCFAKVVATKASAAAVSRSNHGTPLRVGLLGLKPDDLSGPRAKGGITFYRPIDDAFQQEWTATDSTCRSLLDVTQLDALIIADGHGLPPGLETLRALPRRPQIIPFKSNHNNESADTELALLAEVRSLSSGNAS